MGSEMCIRDRVQTDDGEQVVGVNEDFSTALEVARCMAENEQHVVLIQPL